MNGKTTKVQGRGGTAPLPGESSLTFTTFTRARNNRVASVGVRCVSRTANGVAS